MQVKSKEVNGLLKKDTNTSWKNTYSAGYRERSVDGVEGVGVEDVEGGRNETFMQVKPMFHPSESHVHSH